MEHEHRGIMMIPIDALQHHPDNPRKDLGDLRELTASIRESGVMQNLTVVPNPADEETWLVVIGNRRLEASKAAGLQELKDMLKLPDHKLRQAGAGLLWGAVDRDIYRPWERSYDKACIEHKRSTTYEIIYDMLIGMGYEMSDEEAAYLGGTHEVYKPFEEVEG